MPKAASKSKPAAKKAAAAKPAKKLAPVPPNMSWVSAHLTVRNPETAIAFYETAFGFKKGMAMPGPDGKIQHAEMLYQGNMVMLGPEGPGNPCKAPASLGGTALTIYVYSDNVNALTERARKAGAKIEEEPKDQFWGDRTAKFLDPEGHRWMFATRVSEFDPSKAPH